MQSLINRPLYLNRLVEFKDKTVVKIITGIRRSGKSSLLELFSKHLLDWVLRENGPRAREKRSAYLRKMVRLLRGIGPVNKKCIKIMSEANTGCPCPPHD